jgi:Ca-activated chloride channel homolog
VCLALEENMNRRFFFRLSFLLPIFTLAALTPFTPRGLTAARFSQTEPGAATEGRLLALDAEGKLAGQLTLKHTDVKADVTGFLSRVTVTQLFENPFEGQMEAVYVFPLPQAAAVDDMTMTIGGRTIRGRIMRREEAKDVYEQAKASGQVASLLDQERPNIFTQSVANISPGQPVQVTISYVETLKYEEGSYEWSFPMVVGPRYVPGGDEGAAPDNAGAAATPVPDAARIQTAPVPSERPGRDVSIEITLDAGVPLDGLSSALHEVDILRPDDRRAVVRLKNLETIPNRDFVLKYDVSGGKIEDAVLAHRAGRGGFFTLIMQPPERVTVGDVTPKELVFVVDTSGSMGGFPIEKATETAGLALDGLYPQDTFNVITFAGATKILFEEPVPATPENIARAKKLLREQGAGGGTEMMKAIRAALEPSDSQAHVRIVCFMTDGQVGDDLAIIGEVQKHKNARVFAMGFGDSPNRFLLDKITEYGRGEAEYVTQAGDTSKVAERFHRRVREPLLTDISVEWEGVTVSDVFPKIVPDLFSAKPVILSGRYAKGGRGVLRLRGKMSGRDFSRELAVELPESEARHDVLATLWARRKIDDLMGRDMRGLQAGTVGDELREAITRLGLDYRLMTQFTSFVAVDDGLAAASPAAPPAGADADAATDITATNTGTVVSSEQLSNFPAQRTVQSLYTIAPAADRSGLRGAAAYGRPVPGTFAGANFPGGVSATVTITSSSSAALNTTASTVSTVETRTLLDLPVKGRTHQSFVYLSPGAADSAAGQSQGLSQDRLSVNGQRPASNSYVLDGVSANFGVNPDEQDAGASASGTMAALTVTGGTNGLASLGATQEVTIRTLGFEPRFGRSPGGEIEITTRAGTNQFHGSLFESFGNDALDAGDWFANSRGLAKPPHRLNNFGGTFGGPVRKDKTFFFGSYEGLRLRQPAVAVTDVPSLPSRLAAPAAVRPFLDAYPLPTGAERPDGFAEFAGAFSNPARLDAGSLRLDHSVSDRLTLTARYNFAASSASERGAGGFSLNTVNERRGRLQTLTGGATFTATPSVVLELRANYSRLAAGSAYALDGFGGALPPAASTDLAAFFSNGNRSARFDLDGRNAALFGGDEVSSTQRQFHTVGSATWAYGAHTFNFGADYRRVAPVIGLRPAEAGVFFNGVGQSVTGTAARAWAYERATPQRPVFHNLSAFGQDEWRVTPRLTLTYGARWTVNPAPRASGGVDAPAAGGVDDPAGLNLAQGGARLWETTYGNFAPRVGVAYQPAGRDGEFVLRAGFGVFYDAGTEQAGRAYADSYPFVTGRSLFDRPFPAAVAAPPAGPGDAPLAAFDPRLKQPFTLKWNFEAQHSLGDSQSFSAAYVGAAGRRLLLTESLFDGDAVFPFIRLTTNGAESDYHAMQLQFNRQPARGLQALVSYTWAKSLDDYSRDAAARALLRGEAAGQERGPSDFDVRHSLSGYIFYELPSPFDGGWGEALLRDWTLSSIFTARSARPLNIVYALPTGYGFAYLRPDIVAGVPVYVTDPAAPGGRLVNPAAFAVPAASRQGTLGRNSLRGFPLYQADLGLGRRFRFTEEVSLSFRAEVFNLFNRANLADPGGRDASLGTRLSPSDPLTTNGTFGRPASMYGRSLLGGTGGSFDSFHHAGGPRHIQFSLKFEF